MARPFNTRTGNLGSGTYGTRKRECVCGRTVTVGGPWTQHVRSCEAARQDETEREAARILRELGAG